MVQFVTTSDLELAFDGPRKRLESPERTDRTEQEAVEELHAFQTRHGLSAERESNDFNERVKRSNLHRFLLWLNIQFERFVGMRSIKNTIVEYVLIKLTNPIGFQELTSRGQHTIITGNPGTGKSSVADLWARVLYVLGVIESGRKPSKVKVASLVAGYSGQSQKNMREKIQPSRGSVLVLDEAHELAKGKKGESGSHYRELFDELFNNMDGSASDGTDQEKDGKFTCILMGYAPGMKEVLSMNDGMGRRLVFTFHLDNYTVIELSEIFLRKMKAKFGRQLETQAVPCTWKDFLIFRKNTLLGERVSASPPTQGQIDMRLKAAVSAYFDSIGNSATDGASRDGVFQWFKTPSEERDWLSPTEKQRTNLAKLCEEYHVDELIEPIPDTPGEAMGDKTIALIFDRFTKRMRENDNAGLVDQVIEQLIRVESMTVGASSHTDDEPKLRMDGTDPIYGVYVRKAVLQTIEKKRHMR